MYGFYCVAFTDDLFAGKTLLDYTNLFFPNENFDKDLTSTSRTLIYMVKVKEVSNRKK